MTPVPDHKAYASRLNHTMDEKLFFLEHISGDIMIVDFGAAGWGLGREAARRLIAEGRLLLHVPFDTDPRHGVLSEWSEVAPTVKGLRQASGRNPTVLLFSSVLHEVFSTFSEFTERQWVLNHAEDISADYIVIRDMARPPGISNVWAAEIEAFLKAPWLKSPDAEREAQERYFSVPWDLGRQIEDLSGGAWRLVFERHYIPDGVRQRWLEEGRGTLKLPPFTHMQLILKRSR